MNWMVGLCTFCPLYSMKFVLVVLYYFVQLVSCLVWMVVNNNSKSFESVPRFENYAFTFQE